MQPLEIVAHAKHQAVLVPFDHIDVDIGVPKRCKLGRPIHVMQPGEKLKQRAIVF